MRVLTVGTWYPFAGGQGEDGAADPVGLQGARDARQACDGAAGRVRGASVLHHGGQVPRGEAEGASEQVGGASVPSDSGQAPRSGAVVAVEQVGGASVLPDSGQAPRGGAVSGPTGGRPAAGPDISAGPAPTATPVWPVLVAALRARGDTVHVLTTEAPIADPATVAAPGHDGLARDDDTKRTLQWFWGDGRWRRPARLEASRIARHDLRVLGDALRACRAEVVVWAAMGGLPLTLVGASGVPEMALVHDPWPRYGPQVDPQARREGWDPGAVACWSCASVALRADAAAAMPAVEPARLVVDAPGSAAAWSSALIERLGGLAGGR